MPFSIGESYSGAGEMSRRKASPKTDMEIRHEDPSAKERNPIGHEELGNEGIPFCGVVPRAMTCSMPALNSREFTT